MLGMDCLKLMFSEVTRLTRPNQHFMKKLLTIIILMASVAFAIAQPQPSSPTFPCVKQISTTPLAPYNPDYNDGYIEHVFLNEFSWYDHDQFNFLYPYPLEDMTQYGNTQAMLNIFNPNILNYPQLNNGVGIEQFDYYPEDGWELISINLGYYPDGTTLAEHNALEESAFQDIPYIIFYNKQRSILRIFANTTTGLNTSFNPDAVRVTLRFAEDDKRSGLLRTGAKYDKALDKTTDVSKLVTLSKTPGQSNHWFMAQFALGYDPCTCFFQSDLRVTFQFFDESSIGMNSNGVSTTMNLSDILSGNYDVDGDFLANVNYTDGHASSGTIIYNTLEQMYQNYIDRLEYVKAQNELIAEQNEKINDALTIIKLAKGALVNPIANWISDPDIVFVLVKLGLFTHKSGTDQGYSVKPNYDKIESKAKEYLGQGFDWLTNSTKKGIQQPLTAPPMPTGTVWQASFDGQITNYSPEIGPVLFNPGSYPLASTNAILDEEDEEQMADLALTAHTYPYYNEVLGLFALVETPKFLAHYSNSFTETKDIEICSNVEHTGMMTGEYDIIKYVHHEVHKDQKFQLQLNSPLKFVMNPAAGIDYDRTIIKTSLIIRAKKNNAFSLSDYTYTDSSSDHYNKKRDYIEGASIQGLQLNNLVQVEGVVESNAVEEGGQLDVVYASPFVTPDVLNEMVIQLGHYRKEEFKEYPTAPWNFAQFGQPCPDYVYHVGWDSKNIYDSDYGANGDFSYVFMNLLQDPTFTPYWSNFLENYYFELKIMVDFHFLEPGYGGTDNTTTQVYTYLISPEDLINTSWMPEIPFDLVHNPETGPGDHWEISTSLGLVDTHFDASLATTYPIIGTGFDVRAIEEVTINGNISVDPDLFPASHVDIVAGNEIIVEGESLIHEDVTLKIDPFWTSSPTPIVTDSEITAFCKGQSAIPYQANLATRSQLGENQTQQQSNFPSKRFNSNVVQLFPNPAHNQLNVRITNISKLQKVEIISSLGSVLELPAPVQTNDSNTYFMNIEQLGEGCYSLRGILENGEVFLKQFIVIH